VVESFCRALLMSVGLVHLKFRMRNFLHFLLAFYLVSPLVDASVANLPCRKLLTLPTLRILGAKSHSFKGRITTQKCGYLTTCWHMQNVRNQYQRTDIANSTSMHLHLIPTLI